MLLLQGQVVSTIGSQLFNVGLMYWLLETTGSATTMGLVMTASLVPVAVFGMFSGALVDRLPYKWTIVGADLVRGMLCIGLAILVETSSQKTATWLLILYVLLAGVASSLFAPALRAALPEVVGRGRLQQANSLIHTARSLAGTLSAAACGFLYAWLGAPWLFLLNGISFLLSALSECFVGFPVTETPRRNSLFRDVKEGFRYIVRQKGLRRILATVACMNITSAPLTITLPMLVRDYHHAGPALLGLLAASQGVGSIVAGSVLARSSLSAAWRPNLTIVSLWVCAASLLGMIALSSSLGLMSMFALYGAGIVCFNIPIQTAIQLNTQTRLRGRVISASTTLVAGFMPLAAALTGIAVDAIGHNVAAVWLATASIFIGCAVSLAMSRDAKSYLSTA